MQNENPLAGKRGTENGSGLPPGHPAPTFIKESVRSPAILQVPHAFSAIVGSGPSHSASTTFTSLASASVSPRTMSVILATSAASRVPDSVATTTLTLLSPMKATHSV